jgi:hypothetical protein
MQTEGLNGHAESVGTARGNLRGFGRPQTLLESTAALAHYAHNRVIGATVSAVVIKHLIACLEQLPEIGYICVGHEQRTVR